MRNDRTKTISLSKKLLAKANRRAKEDGESFSSYLRRLIMRDLNGELPTLARGEKRAA